MDQESLFERVFVDNVPSILADKSLADTSLDEANQKIAIRKVFIGSILGLLPIFLIKNTYWQIIYAIGLVSVTNGLFWFFYLGGVIKGEIKGAKYALQNPPPLGDTYIQYTDGDEILYESEHFIFESPPEQKGKSDPVKMDRRRRAAFRHKTEKDRFTIVEHYRKADAEGRVANKEGWAQTHYRMGSRSLLNYEQEYDSKDKDYIDRIMGR